MRVVLDCDTANEIDDQFAIAYALGSSNLDVLGVVSVQNTIASGPGSRDLYHEEALRIVELSGAGGRVPCLKGAGTPMEDDRTPVHSEGLDFLISAASEGPLTILATGPATDLASFALIAPSLRQEVRVVWAGAFPNAATWEQKKFGELNARADIASWRRLYTAPGPLSVLPGWPAVEQVAVNPASCSVRLRRINSPISIYLAKILESWTLARGDVLDMDTVRSMDDPHFLPSAGKVLWDIVNVAAATRPETVTFFEEDLPDIDPAGCPDWTKPGRKAQVGLELDAAAILDDFWAALERLPLG